MPPIRFLASARYTKLVAVILLFSEIIPIYSRCAKKKLVCIVIIALFSCQPSSYSKCTKSNIYLSCDIQSVSDAEYAFFFILSLSHPNSGITQQYTALLARRCIL